MNAVYEYLFMGLLLIVIFGASVAMVGIITVPMQGISDRQNLQVIGEKVLTQILTSTGSPVNWGKSISNINPTYFGLAQKPETTRQTYVLDIDKIQRLNPNDPYGLDAKTVQKTLNLERTFGFALKIMPIFDINVSKGVGDTFTASVFWHEDGLPVTNANVTARMFYFETDYYRTPQLTSITGVDGKTLQPLNFIPYTPPNNSLKVLFVVVDYLGLKASQVFSSSDWRTLPAYQVGEYLLIDNAYQVPSNNLNLTEVLATKVFQSASPPQYSYNIISVSTTLTDNGTISTPRGVFRSYAITNPEPAATGLVVVQKIGFPGDYYLAITSREINLNFSTTPGLTIFPPGVRLQRLVTIEDTPYYAQLYLWRLSQ